MTEEIGVSAQFGDVLRQPVDLPKETIEELKQRRDSDDTVKVPKRTVPEQGIFNEISSEDFTTFYKHALDAAILKPPETWDPETLYFYGFESHRPGHEFVSIFEVLVGWPCEFKGFIGNPYFVDDNADPEEVRARYRQIRNERIAEERARDFWVMAT